MKSNVLGQEKIGKLFFQYTIPSVIAMLFLGLNSIIDGFFVGNYIGVNALASVNIAMPFVSIVIAIGVIIGIGSQSIIGRNLGRKNYKVVKNATATAIMLALIVTVALAVVTSLFTKEVAYFLGSNDNLLEYTMVYIKYWGLFMPALGVMLVLDYLLKVFGWPIYAMLALVSSIIGNIILNYLFIVKLGFGVQGAALATGLAFVIALILASIPFFLDKKIFSFIGGKFEFKIARNILYNGCSEGLSEIGTGITTFLFNIVLISYAGEIGVAAFTAISYINFVSTNILLGLTDGVGAIISYNFGSRQVKRVKKTLKMTAVAVTVVGMGIFVFIYSFSDRLIAIFLDENNTKVMNFAVVGAEIYAYAFLLSGINALVSAYFTATGRPGKSGLIAINKGIIWVAIGVFVLPKVFGIVGIWLTVPIAEFITLILSAFLIKREFRRA